MAVHKTRRIQLSRREPFPKLAPEKVTVKECWKSPDRKKRSGINLLVSKHPGMIMKKMPHPREKKGIKKLTIN